MCGLKEVPYSEWVSKVRLSIEKGRNCYAFKELMNSTPILSEVEYEKYAYNEIAKLEVVLLKSMLDEFQKSVNLCLEEHDLFIFEKGIRELKKSIRECLFFECVLPFSKESKEALKSSIRLNLAAFLDEFSKYVRRLSEYEGDPFLNDFLYLYKKANLRKFIQEQVVYE